MCQVDVVDPLLVGGQIAYRTSPLQADDHRRIAGHGQRAAVAGAVAQQRQAEIESAAERDLTDLPGRQRRPSVPRISTYMRGCSSTWPPAASSYTASGPASFIEYRSSTAQPKRAARAW